MSQVKPDVCGSVTVAFLSGHLACQLDGFACDSDFRKTDAPGDSFNNVPVAIARGKIHTLVRLGGIPP
ncbi:MAG: hypothetical protein DMG11_24945 [Acidobacteria bacterium]|nr:MAG: hypothetical protein DMG11_24945 [Acidobacteriota bacterium]